MSEKPFISFEQHGSITLGRVERATVLDAQNVAEFGRCLMTLAEQSPGAQVLLDFSQVGYLSSAVLNELLGAHRALLATNGNLRLSSLNEDILKVFEITNLDKVFVIYDSWEDGLKKYQRSLELEAQDRSWEEIGKDS